MAHNTTNPLIAELEKKLSLLRTEAKLAKANESILVNAAAALDDPANITDVQQVLREEAQNFKDDAAYKQSLARVAWMELREAKRTNGRSY